MSIEKLPSGKYRAVVRHAGAKRASEAVESVAAAKMLEGEAQAGDGRIGVAEGAARRR